MQQREFRAVRIERGPQGWGGPLVVQPTAEKDKIVAVTGGGIPEVAKKIAELTGAEAVDGFRAPPPESEMAAVVVDCGGTARAGRVPAQADPDHQPYPRGAGRTARPVHHGGYLRLRGASGQRQSRRRVGGAQRAGDRGRRRVDRYQPVRDVEQGRGHGVRGRAAVSPALSRASGVAWAASSGSCSRAAARP